MIFDKEKSATILTQRLAVKIKKKLMADAWNPAYFRDEAK